jgi:hypothetical protein
MFALEGIRKAAGVLAFAIAMLALDAATAFAQTPALQKLEETYRLADGENAKLIPPPFSDERAAYHREAHPGVTNCPGQYGFKWKDGKLLRRASWWSEPGTVASALSKAGIEGVDLDGLTDLFDMPVAGDWIVRDGATREQILADVERILDKTTDGKIKVQKIRVEKDVIVARGKYEQKLITDPPPPREPKDVHLFVNNLDGTEGAGGGGGTLDRFFKRVAQVAGMKIVNEAEPYKGDVSWTNNRDADEAQKSSEMRERLLKHVSEQTSLEFRIEKRKVDAWRVIDTTGKAGGL